MWPFDELFTPKKANPLDEINDRDVGGMVCLKCGDQPKELLNVDGLYYCSDCNTANERTKRWEEEEHIWKENKDGQKLE